MAHFPRPITSASSMAYSQDNLVLPPSTQRELPKPPSWRRPCSARGFVHRRFLQRLRSSVPDLDHAHGVAETSPFAGDPKHLGADIGVTAVLHTWDQNLQHHPHVHCIVPGGGLSPDGERWIACRNGFFLPVRVLSRLF